MLAAHAVLAVILASSSSPVSGAGAPAVPGPTAPGPMMMKVPTVAVQMASDTVVVPMRLVEGRIEVSVKVNGQGPFPFIFDTGARGTVLDLAFAREQGLKLGEPVTVGSPTGAGRPGQLATIDRLQVGGLTLRRLTAVAFEGLPFKQSDPPRGVMGPYGLSGLLVTLDYPNARLVFRHGTLEPPDGREVFGWDAGQPLPEIPITVAGHRLKAHLDSGATHGLSLPPDMARTLPLAGPLVDGGKARAVDQEVEVKCAPLRGNLEVGRYTVENPLVFFSDMQKDFANVGPPVLRQFALTIDAANRRLKLGGPAGGKLDAFEDAPHH